MKKYIFLATLGMATNTVIANDTIVFSCFAKNGKQIAILESNGYYEYSFGKPGKPELVFKNSIKEVEKRSEKWNGVGAWYWEEYNLKNGEFYYTVYSAVNRMTEEHEQEGSVTVFKGNKELARIVCDRF
ncbi:hypothetical protein [Ursidibacter arcticus]